MNKSSYLFRFTQPIRTKRTERNRLAARKFNPEGSARKTGVRNWVRWRYGLRLTVWEFEKRGVLCVCLETERVVSRCERCETEMAKILHCGKIYGSEWADLNVRRCLRARRLRSAAGSINSGRHILAFTMRRALRKRHVFDFVPSYLNKKLNSTERGALFRHFASPRWSPLRMRTKVVSFFFFSKSFQTKKIMALRPKMTKIASRWSCLKKKKSGGGQKKYFCQPAIWSSSPHQGHSFFFFFCQYIFYKDGQIANRS